MDQLKRDLFALRIKFAKQEVSEIVLGNGQQFTMFMFTSLLALMYMCDKSCDPFAAGLETFICEGDQAQGEVANWLHSSIDLAILC